MVRLHEQTRRILVDRLDGNLNFALARIKQVRFGAALRQLVVADLLETFLLEARVLISLATHHCLLAELVVRQLHLTIRQNLPREHVDRVVFPDLRLAVSLPLKDAHA